jgi:hypothetical protein
MVLILVRFQLGWVNCVNHACPTNLQLEQDTNLSLCSIRQRLVLPDSLKLAPRWSLLRNKIFRALNSPLCLRSEARVVKVQWGIHLLLGADPVNMLDWEVTPLKVIPRVEQIHLTDQLPLCTPGSSQHGELTEFPHNFPQIRQVKTYSLIWVNIPWLRSTIVRADLAQGSQLVVTFVIEELLQAFMDRTRGESFLLRWKLHARI